MKNAWMLIILVSTVSLCGCGPKFYFDIREVTIETVPSNARVTQINSVDGSEIFLGNTPVRNQPVRILSDVKGKLTSISADRLSSQLYMVNVRIDKTGYETYKGNLATSPETSRAHRIVLERN